MKTARDWLPTSKDLDWIETASPAVHPVLAEIERAAEPSRIPILDRASGRVLGALAAGRERIVEVGTAYGYSTLCMALAQPRGGTIVTIDPDRERTDLARVWWRKAGVEDERVKVVNRPALDAFADRDDSLSGPFDMVFIDALKPEYLRYLEALIPRLAPGALVVADNVLWSGRVSGERGEEPADESTVALRQFNETVLRDPRFVAAILPVGDGLLVATLRG
ncbi:MAG TPA: O-methyltransferase [Candidatus Limnocylindrales bacterium]|jgi:caffeoyl-CoA O-methyltransferase